MSYPDPFFWKVPPRTRAYEGKTPKTTTGRDTRHGRRNGVRALARTRRRLLRTHASWRSGETGSTASPAQGRSHTEGRVR